MYEVEIAGEIVETYDLESDALSHAQLYAWSDPTVRVLVDGEEFAYVWRGMMTVSGDFLTQPTPRHGPATRDRRATEERT